MDGEVKYHKSIMIVSIKFMLFVNYHYYEFNYYYYTYIF